MKIGFSYSTLIAGFASVLAWPACAANNAVPDLSGFWEHTVPQEDWENLPSTALGPVHRSKASGPAHQGGTGGNLWIGDYTKSDSSALGCGGREKGR
jgi:hypothetical protein